MPVQVLRTPSAFDQFAYSNPAFEPTNRDDLGRVRAAHMALLRMQPDAMQAALRSIETVTVAPARGVRLMLRVVLGEAEFAVGQDISPAGHDPLELEETCHCNAAVGVAHAMLGNLERASAHMLVARTLAAALGLHNRQQNLTVEWARICALRGQPEPDAIQQQLRQVMPPLRRAWSQRTLAESYMGQGLYSEALRALGTPDADTALDRALRNFLSRLLAFPVYPELDTSLPYAQLAAAMGHAVDADYTYSLASVTGSPTREYAAIFEAAGMTRSRDLAQQGVRSLGRMQFQQADLAAYRLLILMWAVAEGAALHGGAFAGREVPMMEQMLEALRRLRRPDEVLQVIRRLGPDQFTLLALSPIGDQVGALRLQGLPLLAGKRVILGGEEFIAPGRTGTVTVLEAMGLPFEELTREERGRYRKFLAELPFAPVNLGWVAQACQRLAVSAARLGHPNEAAGWKESYVRVLRLMHPETQEAIRTARKE